MISWNEALPSDNSTIRVREVRDLLRNTQRGLETSLEWPSGEVKPGATKAFVESTSSYPAASENTNHGRLLIESDKSRAYAFLLGSLSPSQATQLVGSPNFIEHLDDPGDGIWMRTSGFSGAVMADWDDQTERFSYSSRGKGTGIGSNAIEYSAPPLVFVESENTRFVTHVSQITRGGFKVSIRDADIHAVGSRITLRWHSLGTLSTASLP